MLHRSTPATAPAVVRGAQVGVAQRVVASHSDHRSSQETVARSDGAGFPVERTTIVGSGLQTRERGRGRLSSANVAGRGGVSGIIVGALVGWLLVLFGVMTPEFSALWVAVNAGIVGAVLGATVALLGYVITRGRRWFTYPPDVRAQQYEVLVDADVADDAVRILRSVSSAPLPDDVSASRHDNAR